MSDETGDSVPVDNTPEPPAEDKTFTQAQVDAIVRDRVARVKTTPPDDYEDLKSKASRLAEIEKASQTELQRVSGERDEYAQRISKLETEAKESRLYSALIAEAAKADRKIVDPEAAVALLDRSQLEFGDDGTPTNVAKAMDLLLEQRPFLVAKEATRGSADQGARQAGGIKQVTEAELKTMRPADIDKARKEGRLNDLLGVR